MSEGFRHIDGARTIVFGADAINSAGDLLASGYTLLTTPRAAATAPAVVAGAAAVVAVPAGQVDAVAAQLRASVTGTRLVALGGGRVIDVAKALAAADAPRQVLAIPTSLSGAEMTGVHRHARGVEDATPRVRPHVVVNDPALSASQPVDQLAASSANALGHALTALINDRSTPIARAVAADAVARLAAGWTDAQPDRQAIALGALLAGWAVDHSSLGPHHALAQTLVREAALPHAQVNAALLPFTALSLRARDPDAFGRLDERLARPIETLADDLRRLAAAGRLVDLADDPTLLDRATAAASRRPELARVTPAVDEHEVARIYRSAAAPITELPDDHADADPVH
jgi:alcohol dehydrogenase class IV